MEAAARPSPGARTVRLWAWALVLGGATWVVLLPALWNGFPFMFYDTGAFIDLALRGGFMPERSAVYGAFLAAFRPAFSLWLVAVAQVVLAVLVMAEFVRVVRPGLSPLRFFIIVVALTLLTSLPWTAPEVMPDIFAPVLVLCMYLLGFHAAELTRPRKMALAAVAVLSATSHASHLGLAGGLAAVTVLAQLASRHAVLTAARPRWGLPTLVFLLSVSLVMTSNFSRTGEVFVSKAGPGFILARLMQDGIAQRVLDDTCPDSGFRLCAYRHELPHDSNDFLWQWNSPFWKLGGFTGIADEASDLIEESIARYPLLNLKAAAGNTFRQFFTFKTGDGVEALDGVPEPALQRGMPDQLDDYRAARQQTDAVDFTVINMLQVPLGGLSMIVLVAVFVLAVRGRRWDDRLFLPGFVLLALLGNAFICGAMSSPHDRYQARLIWLATFAVMLLLPKIRRSSSSPLPAPTL